MRLIDADELRAYWEECKSMFQEDDPYDEQKRKEFDDAIWDLDNTMTAVELVRCKDCKWFGDFGCAIRIVDESDKPKETDFCSFGERREDG